MTEFMKTIWNRPELDDKPDTKRKPVKGKPKRKGKRKN